MPLQNPKLLDRLTAAELLRELRAAGKSVVFTNGCFDILHPGHVAYLQDARSLGDFLIVGLNSDASVGRLKGKGRPIVDQVSRAFVLAGLSAVDAVTFFDEDTPLELIKAIRPDILVKGGDYRKEDIVGAREVEAAGGRVIVIPFVEGFSTSNIVQKINQQP